MTYVESTHGFCGGCRNLIQSGLGEFRCSIDNDIVVPFHDRKLCPIVDEKLFHNVLYRCNDCDSLLDDMDDTGPTLYCGQDICVYERKFTDWRKSLFQYREDKGGV